jgi:hypothetical protein
MAFEVATIAMKLAGVGLKKISQNEEAMFVLQVRKFTNYQGIFKYSLFNQ